MTKSFFSLAAVSVLSFLTACTTMPEKKKNITNHLLTLENPKSKSISKPSVLVIGGGLAGLTAAYELEKNDFQIDLLEARYRLGGRVITNEFVNSQISEGGAELIDADTIHPNIHHYIKEFNLKLSDVGYDSDKIAEGAYYLNHRLFAYDDLEKVLGTVAAEDEKRFWESLYELGQKLPSATHPERAPEAKYLDSQSALQWVDSLNLTPEIKKIALHHIRSEYGEPENLSLLFLAQQQKAYENINDDEVEIYRINGGNSQLVNGFLENIKGGIHLNSPVVSLVQDDKQVVATTQSGKKYKADYAIVSIPSRVLDRIKFQPELSDIQKKAISELNYGQHNKVLLQYNKRFWLDHKLGGDVLSDLPVGWIWEGTDQQKGRTGVLVTYTSGIIAKKEMALTDQEIIEKRKKEIEQIYPKAKDSFIDAAVYRWNLSPWLKGGYTAYSPHQVIPFWGVFKKPHHRIYFSGEHTDDLLPGYMEGAIRSGKRAVNQVINK